MGRPYCDRTSQSRINRAKYFTHASGTQGPIDFVWTELRTRHQNRDGRSQQARRTIPGGPIEGRCATLLREQRFHFAAQLRIGPRQQRCALTRRTLQRGVVQFLDLLPA